MFFAGNLDFVMSNVPPTKRRCQRRKNIQMVIQFEFNTTEKLDI